MITEIKEIINKKARPEKIDFQRKIIKSSYPNLGIPTKELRTLAKSLSLIDLDSSIDTFDELFLHGLVIAYSKSTFSEKLPLIREYLDQVDSWALVDSMCSTFKIKKEESEFVFDQLIDLLNSDKEFYQRFALVMFLTQFLKLDKNHKKLPRIREVTLDDLTDYNKVEENLYFDRILKLIDREYDHYNSSMAAAWLGAEAFLVCPYKILSFINNNHLDIKTHNRLIDKIRQSKNPSKEVKEELKKFKRS